METMLYRQPIANEVQRPEDENDTHGDRAYSGQLVGQQAHMTLTPSVFYPPVPDKELQMWKDWLPTAHVFSHTVTSCPHQATPTRVVPCTTRDPRGI